MINCPKCKQPMYYFFDNDIGEDSIICDNCGLQIINYEGLEE